MALPTKEELLGIVQKSEYRPLTHAELAQEAGVGPEEMREFLRLLRALEKEGLLTTGRRKKIATPGAFGMFCCTLRMTYRGFGLCTSPSGETVTIPADALSGAIHDDKVLVRYGRREDRVVYGRVERVLERGLRQLTGVYTKRFRRGMVKPDDRRLGFSVYVGSVQQRLEDGDRVLVEITAYPDSGRTAHGNIVRVFGSAGVFDVDICTIAMRFGFKLDFAKAVLDEARDVAHPVSSAQESERLCLRQKLIFTIDGEDAKDFDDAVSLERSGTNWRLGVHIADVSEYIRPGTALDKEAYSRATSLYLHGLVLPMLPDDISSGICSLKPHEDRLALSVFVELDEDATPLGVEIRRSVIRSCARLSYTEANEYFETGHMPGHWPEDVGPVLSQMRVLSKALAQKRTERGSLGFDFPEWMVRLDEAGLPADMWRYSRKDAERLIEEFMILANEQIAAYLFGLGRPVMFRVHEPPDKKDLDELNEIIGPLGFRVKATNNPHPRAIQAVLEAAKGSPDEEFVFSSTLRALKKARYAPKWLGHFGLASPMYCHFTAPIRRYPDLVVHRFLSALLTKEHPGDAWAKDRALLDAQSDHCSVREHEAELAERESLETVKVHYMKHKLGEVFDAVICNITDFGMFVRIENGLEGLVHISTLADGWYDHNATRKTLQNRRSGRTYRIGQQVGVQLLRVDLAERKMEFGLIGNM